MSATSRDASQAMERGAPPRAAARQPEAYLLPGALGLFVAVLLVFDWPELIRELTTWQSIAQASAIGIVVSLALLVPLRAGEFNLAIGSTVGASALVTAAVYTAWDQTLLVSVAAGLVTGAAVGALCGWLVAYLQVNSLIVTLGVGILVQGLAEWRTPTSGYSMLGATELTGLFTDDVPVLQLPAAFLIALALAALIHYLLEHVPWGRHLTAIGSNRDSARLIGIAVPRTILGSFVLSGVLGAVAGMLVLGSFGSVSAQVMTGAGVAYWLPALAAVYLGATAFQPGQFNVPGAVVAIIGVKLVGTVFVLARVSEAWPENVVNGAALVLAVSFSGYFARRRAGG